MRTLIAIAKIYKRHLIFQTLTGFAVFVDHERHNFESRALAEKFIDGLCMARMAFVRLLVVGDTPVQ
jgi:hypothetical protein